MFKSRLSFISVATMLLFMLASMASHAEDADKAELIERAMSAAPPSISNEATIMALDGTILREGSNRWTCLPGVVPGDDHPMCNDAVWMKAMDAVGKKSDFSTNRIGISYMLEGDMRVNNADPYDTEENEDEVWVQEGPHLMIIVPDKSMLEGVSTDPHSGEPYVMWKDTPYAHIMVPVTGK